MSKVTNLTIQATKGLIAFLFIYTSSSKILGFEKFVFELQKSPLIPLGLEDVFAILIIASELGVSYLLYQKERLGLYSSLFLMTAFTSYLFTIKTFSNYIPCSCGGVLEKMGWTNHIIFNIFFVLLLIISILSKDKLEKAKFYA